MKHSEGSRAETVYQKYTIYKKRLAVGWKNIHFDTFFFSFSHCYFAVTDEVGQRTDGLVQ